MTRPIPSAAAPASALAAALLAAVPAGAGETGFADEATLDAFLDAGAWCNAGGGPGEAGGGEANEPFRLTFDAEARTASARYGDGEPNVAPYSVTELGPDGVSIEIGGGAAYVYIHDGELTLDAGFDGETPELVRCE